MFNKEVVTYKDELYIVKRKFTEHKDFPTTEMREYLLCDLVLRREGKLYFCEQIKQAEIIEEIKTEKDETTRRKETPTS